MAKGKSNNSIASNLIIRSKLPRPSGIGLKIVHENLVLIDSLVDRINAKQIKIRVELVGDKGVITTLKGAVSLAARAARQEKEQLAKADKTAARTKPTGPFIPSGPASFPVPGPRVKRTITRTETEEGVSTAITERFREATAEREKVLERITGGKGVIERDIQSETEITRAQNQKVLFQQRQERLRLRQQEAQRFSRQAETEGFQARPPVGRATELVPGFKAQTTVSQEFFKTLKDGTEIVRSYDEATGKFSSDIIKQTQASKDAVRHQQFLNNGRIADTELIKLQSQGYKVHNDATKALSVGNKRLVTGYTDLRRVTGSALLGTLEVDMARVNRETGEVTKKTIRAREAMRFLGDSFQNAVAKVGLWLTAVSSIFLVSNAIFGAVTAVKALEANTVFLARVGANLGDTFREAYKEAQLLTNGIVDLSVEFGVSATEAQQAASVFLRAGQNRVQALESTRVAILASSIAELELADAAKLLASATSQFQLKANELLPILDSLNTLSNNYRVSTDDLLQAVSRAGSVYASANGRLETLAATTAVVAQVTSRTGSEIGNAIKTIQSRLASPEVSRGLFERLGIASVDAEGNVKSFQKILFELQTALSGVSEVEARSIKVLVAGARQINILTAALNNVVNIAIAEARALRDSGSATEEAQFKAETLEAALGRLQAQFVNLVHSSAFGGEILKDLINTVNLTLRLANAFDGLLVKIALAAIAFTVLRIVVQKLGQTQLAVSIQSALLNKSLLSTATIATTASVAVGTLTAVFTRLNVAIGVITLGIGFVVHLLSEQEQALAKANLAFSEHISNFERLSQAADRRTQATIVLTEALNEQLAAQRELNKQEGKGGSKEEKDVQERIEKLTAPKRRFGLGIETPEGGVKTEEQIKAVEEANKKLILADRKNHAVRLQQERAFLHTSLTQKEKALEESIAEEKRLRELIPGLAEPRAALKNLQKQVDAQKQLTDEIDLTNNRLQATHEALELAKSDVIILAHAFDTDLQKSVLSAKEATEDFEILKKTQEALDKFSAFSPILEIDNLVEQQKRAISVQDRFAKHYEDAFGKASPKDLERVKDQLIDVTTELEKFNLQIATRRVADFKDIFSTSLQGGGDILQEIQRSRSRLQFIAQEDILGGEKFGDFDAARAQINALKKEAFTLQNVRTQGVQGATPEEKIAFEEAARGRVSELLTKARELEIGQLNKINTINEDITKEMKEQNKEALKALGVLSDEEKIHVLMQARRFAADPNLRLSALDQFLNPADANKLLQQFFPGRLDQINPAQPQNAFERMLLGSGFGIEQETLLAQQRLQAELPGAERRAALESDALARAEAQFRGLEFPSNVTIDPNDFVDLANRIDINIPFGVQEFQPLIDVFEDVVVKQLVGVRDEMMAEVREIWRIVNELPGANRQLPTRNPQR